MNPKSESTALVLTTGAHDSFKLPSTDRWHDPLRLISTDAPSQSARMVLRMIAALFLILLLWAAFGQLDMIASAEGKLTPQTLVKIVQPSEAGVVRELLVREGDIVKQGQILVRLDATLAAADQQAVASELGMQLLQVRRLEAGLAERPMTRMAGDDALAFAQVEHQFAAQTRAFQDSLAQENALLQRAGHELRSARETLAKLEQTVPHYRQTADAFAELAKDGYVGGRAASDKLREATEKERDFAAQRAIVAAAGESMVAQQRKLSQLQSSYRSGLQTELAALRARIAQLQPVLEKSQYRESVLALKAPQDGVIKTLATTTLGAVVQPGTVLMTLVPTGELLFADVLIRNEDVGFIHPGQSVKIKLAAFPFQRYGMLDGSVLQLGADASESDQPPGEDPARLSNPAAARSGYKARVQLTTQVLRSPDGRQMALTPGMQVVAEFNQGRRTVLEYLLSPVKKVVQEAGRER